MNLVRSGRTPQNTYFIICDLLWYDPPFCREFGWKNWTPFQKVVNDAKLDFSPVLQPFGLNFFSSTALILARLRTKNFEFSFKPFGRY